MADAEMYKTRDVRREASRFLRSGQIKQSNNTNKLVSGLDDFVSLVKSKKDRVRKLSAVGRGSSSHEEMGCEVSDREDDLSSQSPPTSVSTSKRFKVPMKFFYDCNGVGHASVPRKLRSAMKKRNRESITPPLPGSKKMKHVNSKKPKLNVEQEGSEWSPRRHKSGPITKDEEEVVETLFALAGMFPDKEATDKSKLVGSLEAIPSALPDAQGSLTPASKGSVMSKEELNSVCPSRKGDTDQSSIKAEELSERNVKTNSLNNPSIQGLSEFPDNKQYLLEAYSLAQTLPFSSKKEPSDEKTLCNPVHFGFASELNLNRGLKQPRSQETSLPKRSPELVPGLLASCANQLEQHSIKEDKKNGLALWPDLSSTASETAGCPEPILQSSTSKIPVWLDTSFPASSRPLVDASFSNDKVSERTARKKLLKRCSAHVYICHLTQVLQTPERAKRPLQLNHLKTSEGPKQENIQMVASRSYGVRNGLNGVVSATKIGNCLPEKGLNAVRSVLQHKNIYQEQQHTADISGPNSSHTQSLDFFSLSSGGGSVEVNKGTQICHKGLEPMSQFHVASLNPLVHHHSQLPLTMSQPRNPSHGYLDRLSSATQQLQLPHYLGTPFNSPHRTNPTNQQCQQLQHAYQQQLQQQSLWTAQYRPAAKSMSTSMSMALLQNWQNGRQYPNIGIQSVPSQEVTGSKYIPISQQQQFMAISSSGRTRSHIPATYEDAGGGLRAAGALPLQLQLLCHERLLH